MIESCEVPFGLPPLVRPGIYYYFCLFAGLNSVLTPFSGKGGAGLLVLYLAHCSILHGLQLYKSDTIVSALQLRSIRSNISSGETGESNASY